MTQPYAPLPYAGPQPVSYAGPHTPMYYSTAGRGRFLRGLLWAMIVLDAVGIGVTFAQTRLPPDAFERDDVEIPIALLASMVVWGLAYTVSIITTIVVFCMWMYRAHANLRALGTQDLTYTSGWAAGAWFVPFLNLVRPFRIMKEIYKGSDPAHLTTGPSAWKLAPEPSIIGWWWAAWLISNFLSNLSMRMDFRGDASLQHAALFIDLAAAPISIASAWLAIQIIGRIDRRQAARADAISQYYVGQYAPPSHVQPPAQYVTQ